MTSTSSSAAPGPVTIRGIEPKDVKVCGKICFDAFAGIADRHNFPRDFPSVEAAEGLIGAWVTIPPITGLVAEIGGRVVGSIFLHEFDEARGLGPCTIAPEGQNARVGRKLMTASIEIARSHGARSIRGVEDSYNMVSNALYASFDMELKETLALMTGKLSGGAPAGVEVRPLEERDLPACGELCKRVHGVARTNELGGARQMFKSFVAVRDGRVTAYASSVTFWPMNHGVAETDEDMMALLRGASAAVEEPIALLMPRRSKLFRWALNEKLRMLKPMNLIVLGDYQEPRGAWFPNVLY
jgi:acetyltransferase (GNAT) family protein